MGVTAIYIRKVWCGWAVTTGGLCPALIGWRLTFRSAERLARRARDVVERSPWEYR